MTPTPDLGKVLNAMQELKIEGDVNLATAVQVRVRWQHRAAGADHRVAGAAGDVAGSTGVAFPQNVLLPAPSLEIVLSVA